jgi:exodeoxyribonuclease-3
MRRGGSRSTSDGLRVVSVYVPNGRAVGTDTFAAKLRFLDAMAERVAALRGAPLVVAGDVNVCPTDLDVYDPVAFVGSTHVTPEERTRLERVLEAGGLVDAYRALHPDEVGFTWWDYRQGHFHRKLGLRIDLALVSADLAGRLTACGIDRGYRKGVEALGPRAAARRRRGLTDAARTASDVRGPVR